MPEKFDASRYVVKLRGKDYLEVRWRLLWFRTEHPEGLIETELITHDLDRQIAVFKATVCLKEGSATGWGQEDAADFGDYLEKAETKALGRALAALGFGTQFAEELDFGAADGRVVDAPVDRGESVDRSGAPQRAAVVADPPGTRGAKDGVVTREQFLAQRKAAQA